MKRLIASLVVVVFAVKCVFGITSFELIEQKYKSGMLSFSEAIYYKIVALAKPSELPQEFRGTTPLKSGTQFARWLKSHQDELPFELKPLVRSVLDRPSLPLTYDTPGGHFKIHYTNSGIDRVPNFAYVERLGRYLDRVWAFEIDTLGYLEPPSDGSAGGDSRYDVYIRNIGAYGITWQENDGPRPWNDCTSYIEINNDFTSFPPNTDPEGHTEGAQKVTSAHEFFHAIQMGYNKDTDPWWMEMTATWMEETAYDTVNDYYNYLETFFTQPNMSLFLYDGSHEYSACVFPIYLSTKWGNDIIRLVWENCIRRSAFDAISSALDSMGTSVEEALAEFFVWNYYTSVRDDGRHYPEGRDYPGVRFEGVHASYPASGSTLTPPSGAGSNYIMFRPGTATGTVQIYVNCEEGVYWTIALAKDPVSGESSVSYYFLPSGGSTTLTISPVERFRTFTLILGPVNRNTTLNYNFSYSARATGTLYPPPINLRAGQGYDRMVPLSWEARPGYYPTSFSVYRKLAGETSFGAIATIETTAYRDYGVVNGQRYVYAVSAHYDTIESVLSDTVWAIPGGGIVVDSVWLIKDNGDGAAYLSDISPGEIIAIRLVPDNPSYSYRLLKARFVLYNHATSAVGESVKVKIFSVDDRLQPDTLVYESPVFWVTRFYPDGWFEADISSASIIFPNSTGLVIGVEFLSGTQGYIPSPLTDSNTNIPRNINFYYSADRWHEHYSFWSFPATIGYNMIRAFAERRTLGIDTNDRYAILPSTPGDILAYPNPFNSKLNIEVKPPGIYKPVEVGVFNLKGERVKTLYCGVSHYGVLRFEWDGQCDEGVRVPSGIYFVRVCGDGFKSVKRVIYLK